MSALGGVYMPKTGYQSVCIGEENGELKWGLQMKEPWHQRMFPVTYTGDFSTQWMWKSLQEKGFDWGGN